METASTFYEQLAQWSEIIGGFAFIAVAVILFRRFVFPAVQAAQVAGNAELVNAQGRREALKADVVKARAELEAADRDAIAIKERAATDAARERQRLLTEARTEGERAVANAENELGRARLAGQAQLRREFIERALDVARAKAATQIDASINTRLIGATVARLVGSDSRSAA